MGSPFPGMDPYLEGEMWQEFHQRLAAGISAQLLPKLRPKYTALLAKRYVLADSHALGIMGGSARAVYPDVHVAETPNRYELRETATMTVEPAVELISPMLEEVPVVSVEIRDVAQRRLVTLIEILSPANKNGSGAREYAQRRLDILQSQTHLLEIDLLRQGERLPLEGKLPPASYFVFLSRANRRPRTEVWPVDLRAPLPVVPLPLLRPDPDVPLDLQAAIRSCFELVGYEDLLDYSQDPPLPPLTGPDRLWARKAINARR